MRWFSKKMAHSSNNGARVPLTHICNEFQSDRAERERESLFIHCVLLITIHPTVLKLTKALASHNGLYELDY